jgi:hypothetical protein
MKLIAQINILFEIAYFYYKSDFIGYLVDILTINIEIFLIKIG